MKTFNTIEELRKELKRLRMQRKSIGFVPTMGYLHQGHLSLLKRAKKENDVVVISIFVNPTQFGVAEDCEAYPRDLDRDSELAESVGADIMFAPSVNEMYPKGYSTYVQVEGSMTAGLCGKQRPGHFKGVTSVVSKLFNIVMPDSAYFGQKDAQQVCIIEHIVKDLNFNIKIVTCPTIREENGLALSSRNSYLSLKERQDAIILSKSLSEAERMIRAGERDVNKIREFIGNTINAVGSANIEYIEIVCAKTLKSVNRVQGNILIALAVRFGKARLIDNIRLTI